MPTVIGAGLLWVGYTAVWWGWLRTGGPVNLLDLIVPGRPAPTRGKPVANASDPAGGGGGFSGPTAGGGGGGGGSGGGY